MAQILNLPTKKVPEKIRGEFGYYAYIPASDPDDEPFALVSGPSFDFSGQNVDFEDELNSAVNLLDSRDNQILELHSIIGVKDQIISRLRSRISELENQHG